MPRAQDSEMSTNNEKCPPSSPHRPFCRPTFPPACKSDGDAAAAKLIKRYNQTNSEERSEVSLESLLKMTG